MIKVEVYKREIWRRERFTFIAKPLIYIIYHCCVHRLPRFPFQSPLFSSKPLLLVLWQESVFNNQIPRPLDVHRTEYSLNNRPDNLKAKSIPIPRLRPPILKQSDKNAVLYENANSEPSDIVTNRQRYV